MGDGTYVPTTGDGEEPLIVQGQLVGQPVVTSSVVTSFNRQAVFWWCCFFFFFFQKCSPVVQSAAPDPLSLLTKCEVDT